MMDLAIAHYGTTLIEVAPSEGEDQASIPITGELARTDEFLKLLGMEVAISNMYPGIGRQYIYKRGDLADPDYFEKDSFTSYTAEQVPDTNAPRISETIFRITHESATEVARQLVNQNLIDPKSSVEDFLDGRKDRLLFRGPDRQHYELMCTQPTRAMNHRIYVWTDSVDLAAHTQGYQDYFNISATGTEDFYAIGTAHLLVREDPGITIALLTLNAGELAPKHSFDIFRDAGYSHFRLASPNKAEVKTVSEEAFPDGGGEVSFVHFQNSYLELVQIGS
jgi:hypothetical protein